MIPTMYPQGEWIIENRRISPHNLRRGHLAIYTSPLDPSRTVCKRVIGLPGDVVCVDPTGKKAPSTEHVVVPKGHLWMSGDNAEMSIDSRDYGPVSMALVKGRQVARIWPPQRFTVFRSNFEYIHE
ncbi:signal peptidase I family protein [Cytidiella melzeri]|nr:signal peptidase I family protein [Cytidiella melzeri]